MLFLIVVFFGFCGFYLFLRGWWYLLGCCWGRGVGGLVVFGLFYVFYDQSLEATIGMIYFSRYKVEWVKYVLYQHRWPSG